jgi:hypothetical protein
MCYGTGKLKFENVNVVKGVYCGLPGYNTTQAHRSLQMFRNNLMPSDSVVFSENHKLLFLPNITRLDILWYLSKILVGKPRIEHLLDYTTVNDILLKWILEKYNRKSEEDSCDLECVTVNTQRTFEFH